ncbi:MAG: isoprenyl transferase [Acidobacteria bacterium]|nr:isoprenyl transferase [Acidobacteriota bacterium]
MRPPLCLPEARACGKVRITHGGKSLSSLPLTASRNIPDTDFDLVSQIDFSSLPVHIAIIMDGNGRWARRRRLPRVAGHRAGAQAVREAVKLCSRIGIKVLTLFAFSTENWKRPRSEIDTLMSLLREHIRKELDEIHQNNIRLQILGRYEQLPLEVQQDLESALRRTAHNTGMVLNVALNYSARSELVDAFHSILLQTPENNVRDLRVTEEMISDHLSTRGLPDPDLLIRTSGEMRVSNFLLWQIAYSEIWVTDTCWPDFSRRHLLQAILDFQKRERRYGGLGRGNA